MRNVIAILIVTTGCDAVAAGDPAVSVTDSAGVAIVENRAPAWTDETAWRLVEPPALTIGDSDGDPRDELFQVAGALILDGDRIVVANQGSRELRFYGSRDGLLLGAVGREGDGPGEFRFIGWVSRFGDDSLFVWDRYLRRGSVFGWDGTYARTVALEHQSDWPVLALADRSLLATPFHATQVRRFAQDGIEGSRRLSLPYMRFSPEGAFLDTVGAHVGNEYWIEIVEHLHDWQRMFGLETVVAAGSSLVWIGTGESFELRGYLPDGTLSKRVIHSGYAPVTVQEVDVGDWMEEATSRLDASSADHLASYFSGMLPPATFPPYDRLLTDGEDNVWVESYRRPQEQRHVWTVFTATGRLLGSLTVPAGFDMMDVRSNRVVGLWRDTLDIEYVQVYRLSKPE